MPRKPLSNKASINVYLHKHQKDLLVRRALDTNKSPSQVMRELIDKELGGEV